MATVDWKVHLSFTSVPFTASTSSGVYTVIPTDLEHT
uniref:Uncharacterized protein n=1 Tax=Anguilla anguilla TaxID=7936 RepID=A0A0E9U8H2_ANGAN